MVVKAGHGRRKRKVESMQWKYDRCVVGVDCLEKRDIRDVSERCCLKEYVVTRVVRAPRRVELLLSDVLIAMAATVVSRPRSALDQRGGLRCETLDHKRSCLGEHVELLLSDVVIAMAATIISRLRSALDQRVFQGMRPRP
ncbi:hypothetical protein EVAR_5006_1 [Eumeta japonica]|uniref:Uncharacterized protein n=1 Tax=Eumeta variegata TaxID=151549 RepID=A0A4C1SX99_EUMVA|nr:hypothetical protein EVAR_5006_1 [Eumeta japonica]